MTAPRFGGLCASCAHMREVVTGKGSRFRLCTRSQGDPAFPKYPPQPVARCRGYNARDAIGTGGPETAPDLPYKDP